MSDTNISKATASNMTDRVENFSVGTKQTDAATGQKETEWINAKAPQYLGYYKTIPELHVAVNTIATYTVGKGFTTDNYTDIILGHITGWGEDTFNSIAWNLLVCKKIYGDAFAEIMRSDEIGELINLKVLDPASIKIIVDDKGIIKRYEQIDKTPLSARTIQKFEPNEILHLSNNRIADQIHGTSIIDAVEWCILAKNEAMADEKKLMHRNVKPIIMFKLDTDNQAKIDEFIPKMDACVNKGENIYVPKGNVEFEIISVPENATLNPRPWIEYLDNFFYQAVGVPKVIIGGGLGMTEATVKVEFLSFSQIWKREQQEFMADLWNQLGIQIKLIEAASLENELLSDQSKDIQTGIIKPNEMQPQMTQE